MRRKIALALILIFVLLTAGLVACTPAAVAIDSVELTSSPKTVYEMGDGIDFADAKLQVNYKNGSSQIVDIAENATVSGFYRNVAGEQIITIRYSEEFSYGETAFTVTVNRPKTVLSKTVIFPTVDYVKGQRINFGGAYATVVYDKLYDGENITETFELNENNLVSGGTSVAGAQTLEFLLYNDGEKDVKVTQEINVRDSAVRSIALASTDAAPDKTAYAIGDALDLTGLKLRLVMTTEVDAIVDTVIKDANGGFTLKETGGIVTAADADGNPFDSSYENTASLYIFFKATETSEVLKTSGTIIVRTVVRMPSELQEELPTYSPAVPAQVVNRLLDFGDTVMTVKFNDQTEVAYRLGDFDPTDADGHRSLGFDVRGFDIARSGVQTLKIVLFKPLSDGEGYSDEEYEVGYNLVVNVDAERVEKIEISDPAAESPEDYKSYVTEDADGYYFRGYVGDVVDLRTLTLTLVYNSGKTESAALSDLTVQGFGSAIGTVAAGEVYRLAEKGDGYISFEKNGVSARLNVIVGGLAYKELSLTEPSKLQYTHGENFSVSGAELAVYYSDENDASGDAVRVKILSESELLPLIDLSTFDTAVSGEKVLKVTYSDGYVSEATTEFSVWVVTTVLNLEIAANPSAVFVSGSAFGRTGSGLVVRQIFSDGSAPVEINDFSDAAWSFSPATLVLADETALSGTVEVTVSYQGASAKFNAKVSNYYTQITDARFVGTNSAAAFKTTEGMAIDLSDYRLTVSRQDGSTAYVTPTSSDYDAENMTVGNRRVTLYFASAQNIPAELSFATDFEVVAKTVERYVVSGEIQHIHTINDAAFIADGLTVRRYYNNGSYENLTIGAEVSFDGYDLTGVTVFPATLELKLKLANGEIISEFEYGGNTVSSIEVIVYEKFAESAVFGDASGNQVNIPNVRVKQSSALADADGFILNSSDITGTGAAYDAWRAALATLNGSYVVVTYTTGASEVIPVAGNFKVVGFEPMRTGAQSVSLVYSDDENVKVNFFVNVTAREVTAVSFADGSSIGAVKEGKALDQKLLLNAKIKVEYDFGNDEVITATADMIYDGAEAFDPAKYVGSFGDSATKTVEVKGRYSGIETNNSLELTVQRKKLVKIDIFGSPKTQYFEGETFNFGATDFLKSADGAADLYFILYYDNDTVETNVKISMTNVDFSAYDNSEMTGQPKAQRIILSYDDEVDHGRFTYGFNIAMNDRANATVGYNPNNAYVYTYGETTDIAFDILLNGAPTAVDADSVSAAFENDRYSYKITEDGYIRTPINGGAGENVRYLPAGTYTFRVTFSGRPHTADAAGLNALTDSSRTVIIRRKQLEVLFDDAITTSRTYDANIDYDGEFFSNLVRFAGFADGEDETFLGGAPAVYVNGFVLDGEIKRAGAYSVKIGGYSSDNYQIEYAEGAFNIAQRTVFVKLKDGGRITERYGASNVGLSERNGYFIVVDANGDALEIGETLDGELLRSQSGTNADGEEVRGNAVGFYRIGIGTLNDRNPDYVISIYGSEEPVFEITKAPLTVTVNDITAVYGSNGIRLSVTFGQFFENDTAETALTGSPVYYRNGTQLNGNTVGLENVGSYELTVDGYAAENYELTFVEGTYTVTRKSATVYPVSSQNKIYGENDPSFRYTVEGLVAGDALSGALGRAAGENVGSYAYTLGTLENSNYTLSLAENAPEFAVSEKPITVVLSDISKQYDGKTAAERNSITVEFRDANGEVYSEELLYEIGFRNAAAGIGNYAIILTDNDPNHSLTLAEDYVYGISPRKIGVEFITKLESQNENEWTPFTSDGDSFLYDYVYKRQMTVRYKLLAEDADDEVLVATVARDNPVIQPSPSNGFTFDNATQYYTVQNAGRWNVNATVVADNNYYIDPTSETLNIDKLELKIYATAEALTSTYNAGEQLAVREYSVNASRAIGANEEKYIKETLSLRVGGGGQQNVRENGYEVMFVLPSDSNYTAVADDSVAPYSVSDYVADRGGYDAANGVLRYVVNKRTVKVSIADINLEKFYDAENAAISAEKLVLDGGDSSLAAAVAGAFVFERLDGDSALTAADSGNFSLKIDGARLTNGNYNAFFSRSSPNLVKNPANPDGEYDKDDYYVYNIKKNTATVEVRAVNGIRGRRFNNRALLSSDVSVNIFGYFPSTTTVSEIMAATGLTFGFSPIDGADANLINVGDYGVTIESYSDRNHEFEVSAIYNTFSIVPLTVNISVWDMYKRYDGTETDNTFRINADGTETPVSDYTKGFDVAAQIYDGGVLRDLTADDFPDCYVEKLEGVNSGRYAYNRIFPETNPNYSFRITATRDYEIKRAQIALGIGDASASYGTKYNEVFDISQYGLYQVEDIDRLKELITFAYTDDDGNSVALSASTPFGVYRVYAVTSAAEDVYRNFEFTVPDNYYGGAEGGGFGRLAVNKAEITVTVNDFAWEYRRSYEEGEGVDFAGANMPEMFEFGFPADFEIAGIDLPSLEGFVYPAFTQEFLTAFAAITEGRAGDYLSVAASSFAVETITEAANENYYFTVANTATITVSKAPLTVETVRVDADGIVINGVSSTINKVYGEVPTSKEIGVRYSGFRGEDFEGVMLFDGTWYVVSGGAYIPASEEQKEKIVGAAGSLIDALAELPKFYQLKQVDVYGYVDENIGGSVYKQWKKIGWEPRVELIYGYLGAGNRLSAYVEPFRSHDYRAEAPDTFVYTVTRRSLTATLSAPETMGDDVVFERTYDRQLKVGEDYIIDYAGLVNIAGVNVENVLDARYAARPTEKPATDGVWAWDGSAWVCVAADGVVFDYENGGFGKYYFVKDGVNEYLYYIDANGEFRPLSATATVEDRPQNLFYDAAPTREWFNLTDLTNRVNSRPGDSRPVEIKLAGLYHNNYDITFENKDNKNYQLAIYNKIDYIMVGDSTLFATLIEGKLDTFIPIKIFYVDGTSTDVIKFNPNLPQSEQSSEYAKRIEIGEDGKFTYDSAKTGNQTLKVKYSEENPLIEGGLDEVSTYIIVRSYPAAQETETSTAAIIGSGGQYLYGNPYSVSTRETFKPSFGSGSARGAFDRVDAEFTLDAGTASGGSFEAVVYDSGAKRLTVRVKSGANEKFRIYVAEEIGGVETEYAYNTYNMTESIYIDLFDGRAHLYNAFVNRLTHELTLVIDNLVVVRHSLRSDTEISETGFSAIRFALEDYDSDGTSSELNSDVSVWFAAENVKLNVLSFNAARTGYENEMAITVAPNESAPQNVYIADGNTFATVFVKSAFFTVSGTYTEGTRVDYYVNGRAVSRDSISEELPEGLYRISVKVVDANQPDKVYSEAYFDLRVMRRAYADGFQKDVGTPTDGSPSVLKTDGLKFYPSAAQNAAEELGKIDMYREYGVQIGSYYTLLSEIGGAKYFSVVNNARNDDDSYWNGAVNFVEYDGTDNLSLTGSDISLAENGISAISVDCVTAEIVLTYTGAGGETLTDSAKMNSVGTFYSGNVADYGYYKMTFGIETDASATVDADNEFIAVINLKSNGFDESAFTAADAGYVGLSLGIKRTESGAPETVLMLKSEGREIGRVSTTAVDWFTATEERFTVEGFFDAENSKITVNIYLGNELKHVFEIKRSNRTASINSADIENEEAILNWDRSDTLIKLFASEEGGQSVILNGATMTVYGVEIGAAAPVRRALYSVRREGGSGSAANAASAPHSVAGPYEINNESPEVVAAMLSNGINGRYGESYNSYAVRFAFTPNGSVDRKIRFILAENVVSDMTTQINAYQNDYNFTASRAVALEYIDNGAEIEMWFMFMTAGQNNVYRQLVYRISAEEENPLNLSDGAPHSVAVNFYKGARELEDATLVSRNVSARHIELYIDGRQFRVDGEGNYSESGTVKRFYFPNYNTLVNWKPDIGSASGSANVNLADKYFLDEYTAAGIAVQYGNLKIYDMYVASTPVDAAGGETYFSAFGGLGKFFD